MGVEGGYNTQQGNRTEQGLSAYLESIKKDFEQTRQEKGDRYFAFSLGFSRSNADSRSKQGVKGEYTTGLQQIGDVLLPQIMNNPELMEVYQTAYWFGTEKQRVHNEIFNKGSISEGDKNRLLAESSRLDKITEAYEKQILAASKPASSAEQLPPLPKLCIEATKYQIRDEAVPEAHTHSCSICLGK